MELNAAAFVSQRAAAAWLAVRLDLLGVVVILLTGVKSDGTLVCEGQWWWWWWGGCCC
jgi:hypothetical protein